MELITSETFSLGNVENFSKDQLFFQADTDRLVGYCMGGYGRIGVCRGNAGLNGRLIARGSSHWSGITLLNPSEWGIVPTRPNSPDQSCVFQQLNMFLSSKCM